MGLKVRNTTRDCVLVDEVRRATSFFSRMRGLLGTGGLPPGKGLWICPCNGIHSLGMAFEFDALFLDAEMRVVAQYRRFRKNRLSRIFWDARGVLELPEGTIERTGTEVGDAIEFRE
ncbi:MAG TPA: DUF192 domain-containing protein [Candidatus Aquicultoraceae bacterium]|nr:DUF192 domain-containing protein [Candidatus Aquicultoraceae bacterium]